MTGIKSSALRMGSRTRLQAASLRISIMSGAQVLAPGIGCRTSHASSLRVRALGSDAMESLMPTAALTTMVPLIKISVIMLTGPMAAPIRIPLNQMVPVAGMGPIPGVPLGSIPVGRPDDIGGSISIIRGPAIPRAEKAVQHAIHEPITVVIDPRGVGADPGGRVKVLGRGPVGLGIRRSIHGAGGAAGQQKHHYHKKT